MKFTDEILIDSIDAYYDTDYYNDNETDLLDSTEVVLQEDTLIGNMIVKAGTKLFIKN